MKEPLFFVIDDSALKNMFEGKKSGDKLLKKLYDMKNEGISIKAVTPLSSFLRAIYLANPNIKINSIQKVLNFLTIIPSPADFKDKKAVIKEVILIAKRFSGGNNERKET